VITHTIKVLRLVIDQVRGAIVGDDVLMSAASPAGQPDRQSVSNTGNYSQGMEL
jgi:hypothetical protein